MYHLAEMAHPLDSARERLNRADENIRSLKAQVTKFLAPFPRAKFRGKKAIWREGDREAYEVLRKQALSGTELPRFSILAGEIIHHLRCAFDHVIWQLSTPEARKKFPNDIEFPVNDSPPGPCKWRDREQKVKHSSYCRKVKGVASVTALARIDDLQPYKRTDNSPLLLIHDLDRFDKHRELVVVIPSVAAHATAEAFQSFRTVNHPASGGVQLLGPARPPTVKVYADLFAQVAFAEFGLRQSQPLVELLEELAHFASDSIESFAGEFV